MAPGQRVHLALLCRPTAPRSERLYRHVGVIATAQGQDRDREIAEAWPVRGAEHEIGAGGPKNEIPQLIVEKSLGWRTGQRDKSLHQVIITKFRGRRLRRSISRRAAARNDKQHGRGVPPSH